jgi:hypothetical protein
MFLQILLQTVHSPGYVYTFCGYGRHFCLGFICYLTHNSMEHSLPLDAGICDLVNKFFALYLIECLLPCSEERKSRPYPGPLQSIHSLTRCCSAAHYNISIGCMSRSPTLFLFFMISCSNFLICISFPTCYRLTSSFIRSPSIISLGAQNMRFLFPHLPANFSWSRNVLPITFSSSTLGQYYAHRIRDPSSH